MTMRNFLTEHNLISSTLIPKNLTLRKTVRTSRGSLDNKKVWYLLIQNESGKSGLGEIPLFKGLSYDDRPEFEEYITQLNNVTFLSEIPENLSDTWPSIAFGIESALQNLAYSDGIYFPSEFTLGKGSIVTNGLIWMSDPEEMKSQIRHKLEQGFYCIKLKIGTRWEEELAILQYLRKHFSPNDLEIRVDANGAFSENNVLQVLESLKLLYIHSIEQPILAGNSELMGFLCKQNIIPIALDEELIGKNLKEIKTLLEKIKPQYIILKPGLLGGFKKTEALISLANHLSIHWWITSSLESNVGLSAISQFTYKLGNKMPQGLGTGNIYTNDLEPILELSGDQLHFKASHPSSWNTDIKNILL